MVAWDKPREPRLFSPDDGKVPVPDAVLCAECRHRCSWRYCTALGCPQRLRNTYSTYLCTVPVVRDWSGEEMPSLSAGTKYQVLSARWPRSRAKGSASTVHHSSGTTTLLLANRGPADGGGCPCRNKRKLAAWRMAARQSFPAAHRHGQPKTRPDLDGRMAALLGFVCWHRGHPMYLLVPSGHASTVGPDPAGKQTCQASDSLGRRHRNMSHGQ